MDEDEKLGALAQAVTRAYVASPEYTRVRDLARAVAEDPPCQTLLTRLKELQARCRDQKTDLAAKRRLVAEVSATKDALHALPLWVNYQVAKDELEALSRELQDELERA